MTKRKQDLARPLAMCRNQVHLVTRALLFLFFFFFFLFGYALFRKTDLNIQIQIFLLHFSVSHRY